jgi:hypothetical protein
LGARPILRTGIYELKLPTLFLRDRLGESGEMRNRNAFFTTLLKKAKGRSDFLLIRKIRRSNAAHIFAREKINPFYLAPLDAHLGS